MQLWAGADWAIIIDAVSAGGAPGTIHCVDTSVKPLPGGMRRHSSHTLGLPEALALQHAMAAPPPRVILYGIEGAEFGQGNTLSEPVSGSIPQVLSMIREEVSAILAS